MMRSRSARIAANGSGTAGGAAGSCFRTSPGSVRGMTGREAADNAKKAGVTDRVRFLTQDLFDADITQATVVTLFLLPRVNQDLIPKLRRELQPGTRIVSHQFDMGEQWPPEKSEDVNGLMI